MGPQLALVTGASSGIGLELAKQFAKHDFELVIVAEDDEVWTAAKALEGFGATVTPVRVDLAKRAGVEELWNRIPRPVDAAALNAGIGMGGHFATETDLEQELRIVDLNCRSTVHLAKLLLQAMVRRNKGRLLITSSIAATMPGSYQAVYNASKSFTQSFGLALRDELRDTHVTVTVLMPGPTDTQFFHRAEMLDTRIGASDHKDDPADVARDGFEALMAGKQRVVSHSFATKLQGRGSRLIPDGAKAALHRLMAQSGSAKK